MTHLKFEMDAAGQIFHKNFVVVHDKRFQLSVQSLSFRGQPNWFVQQALQSDGISDGSTILVLHRLNGLGGEIISLKCAALTHCAQSIVLRIANLMLNAIFCLEMAVSAVLMDLCWIFLSTVILYFLQTPARACQLHLEEAFLRFL